jgi:hypothetical protein
MVVQLLSAVTPASFETTVAVEDRSPSQPDADGRGDRTILNPVVSEGGPSCDVLESPRWLGAVCELGDSPENEDGDHRHSSI